VKDDKVTHCGETVAQSASACQRTNKRTVYSRRNPYYKGDIFVCHQNCCLLQHNLLPF